MTERELLPNNPAEKTPAAVSLREVYEAILRWCGFERVKVLR